MSRVCYKVFNKKLICTKGVFYPTYCMEQNTPMGEVQCPPNLIEQFTLNNYSKIRVQ